jgi:PAS domain S-box-containing protein
MSNPKIYSRLATAARVVVYSFYSFLCWIVAIVGRRFQRARQTQDSSSQRPAAAIDRRTDEFAAADAALQRKLAEGQRAIAERERLFDAALDMLGIAGVDGYFHRVNPAFQRTLGYSEQELCERRFIEFVHPDDRAATMAEMHSLEHGQDTVQFENRYRCKDGSYKWLLWSCPAVRLGEQSLFAAAKDITERKRGEERLRRTVESCPFALMMVDPTGRMLFVNSKAEQLFGYPAGELTGQNVQVLVPERFRATHPALIASYISRPVPRRTPVDRELQGRRKNGEEVPIEIELSPLELEEGLIILCGIIDISEHLLALDAISRAKAAAESSNRAKSNFLANMSHEIRTPMNAVIGMTELLLDTQLTPSQRDYLLMVLHAGESLLAIINEILDFSKIEAGKLDLEIVDFQVWELVGDTMKSLALRAHNKGLELAYHIAQDVPDVLRSDPLRLRQILVNLVGNAIKFTERGEVVVDVGLDAATPAGSGNSVVLRFTVTDTGIGIPLDKQGEIFDAFTQADGSTTRKFGGTGLGLAISSRLVELFGGRLTVTSQPARGSAFAFTVCCALGDAKLSPPLRPRTTELQGTPVLIVDDNATNRRILEEMVRSWGMTPTVAESASAALESLHEQARAGSPIPLLLTDVQMPEMDGYTLISHIRGSVPLAGMSVIVLTSDDGRSEMARLEKVAVSAQLTKPVKQSELLTAIQRALALEPRISGAPDEPRPAEPPIRPLQILLAEDGVVNQRLAVGLLQKWGHHVTVANNGREAVACFRNQPFDLVLMDVQMPEMDGFQATACIRELEKNTGRHVPIVAMTAHAMKGDSDHCLEAGMDGYVAKPMRQRDLHEALAQFFAPGVETPAVDLPKPAAPIACTIDWPSVQRELGGDRRLMGEVMTAFLAEGPQLVSDMQRAIATRNGPALRRAAHTLKGTLQIFHADSLQQLAHEIELLGRDGNLSAAAEALPRVEARLMDFYREMEAFMGTPAGGQN